MGNVWKAMKRREAEAAQQAASEPPAPTGTPSKAPAADQQPARDVGTTESARAGAALSRPTGNGYDPSLCVYRDRGGRVAEEYRALRTNLLASCADQKFCFVVTSAVGGEGKTLTCVNLGFVMAERRDYRTVLVDFDFRRPKMARLLRLDAEPGMAQVLRGQATLEDVVRPTAMDNLFAIPAGKVGAKDLGELVTRPELSEAVAELRSKYDYVLIDTPPVNWVSEVGVIGGVVGEALLVVRMNKTHRESVEKAIGLLHAANVDVAGMVLTHHKYYIPSYLYRYS